MQVSLSLRRALLTVCVIQSLAARGYAAVTMQAAAGTWEKPAFCKKLDCPHFQSARESPADYDIRTYPAALWASTHVDGLSLDAATGKGFMRLFRYISGETQDGSKIEMTAPVTTSISPGAGPLCGNNFTISFYVPDKFQGESGPPAPTSSDVFVERRPEFRAAVLVYSGFSNEKTLVAKAVELQAMLDRDGVQHSAEHYFSAGYDSPFTLVNRHNEVWIPLV